ncbi:TonB-dependent receptor [Leptolyngbya sp. 7M]|uniref:TonB-dependent receptor n=1 Tax=Leptolyngbya sp. 7M TaxID=2812896 RepID=UPI001B8AB067|nr:TonB-dependent receptor [Leptolyngbya sp. 7M]QYO65391.1 TonB-dependent receptor [Leptolyngbya sp. 7M]
MKTESIAKILLAIFVLFGTPTVFAQATGGLAGTVRDQSAAVIQGATVTVRNTATNFTRTVVTNDDGRWSLTLLPVGVYTIAYEKDGFKKSISQPTEVEALVTRTVDVTLEVGATDVFVDVTTDQPLVQTESAAVARQISGEQLIRTPTSVRSFTGLLSSEAGVSSGLSPVGVASNGNISPSVNGTRTTSTSLFFNGIDATNITSNEGSLTDNISPAPETLQEVKLQTSLYDASTGRSGGGNFQLVTKSGGNQLSGSVYYYMQHKALNSNEFFLKEAGEEKPQADRLETGFTIGGPIVKDKFFFFGGYQFTDAKTGLVPTARTRTVLPLALSVLGENRSREAIAAAFNQFNGCSGANCLTAADISTVAFNIFNLRNPVTGGFVLPSISNFRPLGIVDQAGTGTFQFGNFPGVSSRTIQRNNPLVEVIDVIPAKFRQHQFTTRLDGQLSKNNTLSGTLFWANFPGLDPFPDPSSLASPFTLRRADRNRTLSIGNTHVFSPNWINEVRFGYYYLNNTRRLDDPFLAPELSNAAIGVNNPASTFDPSPATTRLGHYIGRNNMANFSFGGPNDSFNKRKQVTYSIGDNVTWNRGNTTFKFGGEYKSHQYDSDLPEEQATEFEKFDSFTQLLTGNATEADTQYGITFKEFRFQDVGLYFASDWKINRRLTMNLGLRYELFMWPTEKNGYMGNFDLEPWLPCFTKSGGTNALCDNPAPGFLVPSNAKLTGNPVVDGAIDVTQRASTKHTLKSQDTNNFAPRIGIAYAATDKLVFRGGYGLFYDRPSAAFINTIFSNYPHLREVEITVPSGNVPIATAFSGVPTNIPLSAWLPFRIIRSAGANGTYQIRDNTPVFVDARGTPQGAGCVPATGLNCIRGNIAETFEFRAIDRNLRTPYVHQWNFGMQYELMRDLMFEARYVGTKGKNLLIARALNQGFDMNDPNNPDHIYERFNQAYLAAGAPNGPLNSGSTARERGIGRAFGFLNPVTGQIDLNLANAAGAVIGFEARVPILGFNVPEALLLESKGYSDYHGAQFGLTKRLSRGLQFNVAYTFSKSIDIMSSDPGSTAGGGKPDVPNTGFIAQGSSYDLRNNRGVSDFDRTHRFSTNFVWDIPTGGSNNAFVKGWSISGFFQAQSGTPFTVFASEPEIANASQYTNLTRGSGGLLRLGFGRPNIVCSTKDAIREYSTSNLNVINSSCFTSALGLFGNLGRNTFRGPLQSRFDMSFAKSTKINERMSFELGFDLFNVFNRVNLANPNSDLQDATDFGTITESLGGPRVGQFRAKFRF